MINQFNMEFSNYGWKHLLGEGVSGLMLVEKRMEKDDERFEGCLRDDAPAIT